eukprot:TRINITY_DN21049_c0_g1_i1.p1 TRINITY_DN21049_c0_g1~~TRINITY_DN21049_c0_g1_i1.p1  ORF type:complete len:649 (-),score=-51.96 TRINITY_DN21049_c0_g1_i1:21-1676(-)
MAGTCDLCRCLGSFDPSTLPWMRWDLLLSAHGWYVRLCWHTQGSGKAPSMLQGRYHGCSGDLVLSHESQMFSSCKGCCHCCMPRVLALKACFGGPPLVRVRHKDDAPRLLMDSGFHQWRCSYFRSLWHALFELVRVPHMSRLRGAPADASRIGTCLVLRGGEAGGGGHGHCWPLNRMTWWRNCFAELSTPAMDTAMMRLALGVSDTSTVAILCNHRLAVRGVLCRVSLPEELAHQLTQVKANRCAVRCSYFRSLWHALFELVRAPHMSRLRGAPAGASRDDTCLVLCEAEAGGGGHGHCRALNKMTWWRNCFAELSTPAMDTAMMRLALGVSDMSTVATLCNHRLAVRGVLCRMSLPEELAHQLTQVRTNRCAVRCAMSDVWAFLFMVRYGINIPIRFSWRKVVAAEHCSHGRTGPCRIIRSHASIAGVMGGLLDLGFDHFWTTPYHAGCEFSIIITCILGGLDSGIAKHCYSIRSHTCLCGLLDLGFDHFWAAVLIHAGFDYSRPFRLWVAVVVSTALTSLFAWCSFGWLHHSTGASYLHYGNARGGTMR